MLRNPRTACRRCRPREQGVVLLGRGGRWEALCGQPHSLVELECRKRCLIHHRVRHKVHWRARPIAPGLFGLALVAGRVVVKPGVVAPRPDDFLVLLEFLRAEHRGRITCQALRGTRNSGYTWMSCEHTQGSADPSGPQELSKVGCPGARLVKDAVRGSLR